VADHRHKRDTNARRLPKAHIVAGPIAIVATAATVGLGVLASNPGFRDSIVASSASSISDVTTDSPLSRDDAGVSRSLNRVDATHLKREPGPDMSPAVVAKAIQSADTKLWTTTELNLWTLPTDDAEQTGVLESGKQVLVTGRETPERVEIVIDGDVRWVTTGYLSDEKPVVAAGGLSMEPCPDPSVENGLTSNAVYVYRSVCHAFPQITSYGGWDAHGEHASGKAIDIMTGDKALGDQIAAFLQSHAAELNLYDVIWWDQIWTPERASEGWRAYGDHGSATANHMDHVHVSTY
jgi:hypothetical protein